METKTESTQVVNWKPEYVSYSGLKDIAWDPLYFYKTRTGEIKRKESNSMNLGSGIHVYLQDVNNFYNQFTIAQEAPSGMMAEFIRKVIEYEDAGFEIDIATGTAYEGSGYKIPFKQVMGMFQKNYGFYEFVKASKGKKVIVPEEFEKIKLCATNLKNDPYCGPLLRIPTVVDDIEDEKEILWDLTIKPTIFALKEKEYVVKVKSIPDRIITEPGLINCVEIKTTSKSVYQFPESAKFYDYNVQAASYVKALRQRSDNVIHRTIVVQTNGFYKTCLYEYSQADLRRGMKKFTDLCERFLWHIENGKWEHPVEYYLQDGLLKIDNYGDNEDKN